MTTPLIAPEADALRRELAEFTYRVSHDFSAPLRTMTEFSRLLKEDYANKLDATGLQYIDLVVNAGDRMRAMLDGILAFSRLNTEPGKPEVLALTELVREIAANYSKRATFEIGDLPEITADRKHMQTLLAALIDNAVKYAAQGSKNHVTIKADGRSVIISDNGIGIEPEFQEDVFMVFRRLHKDSAYPGLGLGLSLAQKIAGLYGGKITVGSQEGKGSTFTLTLP